MGLYTDEGVAKMAGTKVVMGVRTCPFAVLTTTPTRAYGSQTTRKHVTLNSTIRVTWLWLFATTRPIPDFAC